MSEPRRFDVLDLQGPAAPPRRNGELVFSAPWESRLFGLTMALYRSGAFDWEEFRRLLIEEIRARESADAGDAGWSYYTCWREAFERLLSEKGICPPSEIERRASLLAARPVGHDH